MPEQRTWEVVILPDPTTLGAALITATETVPLAEPITFEVAADTGKTQHDLVDDFVVKVMGLERPFVTTRNYAGYWCAVYTVTQVHNPAWLCRLCREAFGTFELRLDHEKNDCELRPRKMIFGR